MSNFAYLQQVPDLAQLHKYCYKAEQYVKTDPDASANNSRKGLEWIVKLIYMLKKKDEEYDGKTLSILLNSEPFLTFIDYSSKIIRDTDYIRKVGNFGSHVGNDVSEREALQAVVNLYNVVGAILMKLGIVVTLAPFDKTHTDPKPVIAPSVDVDAPTQAEIQGLNVQPEAVNSTATPVVPATTALTEEETRRLYIDLLLKEASWKVSTNKGAVMPSTACIEVEVTGMPTASGKGYVDYALFGADGKPLAVIEAKKTTKSITEGIEQAKIYANCLEKKYGFRPVIYVSNGLETKIVDDGLGYPPRTLWGIHSLGDLVLLHQRRGRRDMGDMRVESAIAGRPYQQQAIHAVCEWMNKKHRRGLIVMATGTGKTRTSIALVELMMRNGWVKNALFLADRTALVNQAHKNFEKLLPDCSMCELSDKTKEVDYNARITFCTYQTMIKYVDADVKQFSVGHFDLIIIDEAHRSVFGQYRSIIDYFDAMAVGLTATPRDEVDRSTYELFGMDTEPNFAYEYRDAVDEGYLVDYHAVKRGTKILRNGIKYKDLTDDEKQQMEKVFAYEEAKGLLDPAAPVKVHDIDANKIFKYIYNTDTVDKVLDDLMESGLKVESGEKLGKTIIFAANHKHAELIVERFNARYPQYGPDFCLLIDSQVNFAQSLIDRLSVRDKLPQIAVSVDMLDTGIDVPDMLNLVFFKAVHSYIKFWQMIGRGTRLSEGVFGEGLDKKYFMIFDWCENFDFFDMNPKGHEAAVTIGLTERLFDIQTELVYGMQQEAYQQNPVTKEIYENLKKGLMKQVADLDDHNISVKKHWATVDRFRKESAWMALTLLDVQDLRHEIGPLVTALPDEENTKKWDLIVQQVQLGKVDTAFKATSSSGHMVKVAEVLKSKASIPQVMQKMNVLKEVTMPGFVDSAGVGDLERVRMELRDLVKFLVGQKLQTFTLNIEDIVEKGGDIAALNPVMTYKQKVFDYLRENRDMPVLQKIYNLEPITTHDVMELEDIFWKELGTKADFDKLEHNHSIAMFIRSVIGIDRQRALDRFLELIQNSQLTSIQEEYLNSIIGYVCKNGDITPQIVLAKNSPFPSPQRAFGPLALKVKTYIDILHDSIQPAAGAEFVYDDNVVRMVADEAHVEYK